MVRKLLKMPNKNQRRGIDYEHEIVKMFKENGYTAQRTAGSHSEFDIIVWRKGIDVKKTCYIHFICAIQCKTKKD